MRACALAPQLRQATPIGDEAECEFPVLAVEEVFAGKIRAMIDRKHPRDLYDLFRFRKANLNLFPFNKIAREFVPNITCY